VAAVAYYDTYYEMLAVTNYQHATQYSYDIHGNVDRLVQDNPQMDDYLTGQRYKFMTYQFDLISGNVHEVLYQPGKVDEFYHRYLYDADNRITQVTTSSDHVHWDRDAKYFYYPHGPLSRVELGTKQVQGTDYAYTLHGWIKGVNSTTLFTSRDMGMDHEAGNANSHFAADIYSYALNYYEHGDYSDYNPIGTSNWLAGDEWMDYLGTDCRSLYNGNIQFMTTTLWFDHDETGGPSAQPQLTAYMYDQLNRIISMKAHSEMIPSYNFWDDDSNEFYNTSYSYDANGNIKTLTRNGNQSGQLLMDALEYYPFNAGGYTDNKLTYVKDEQSDDGAYSEDLNSTQAPGNYTYDLIGNLISDEDEGIDDITWLVTGKIAYIQKESTQADLEFHYDAMGNRISKSVVNKSGGTPLSEDEWDHTFYVRDASGNVMATYTFDGGSEKLILAEQHIYGSARIGMRVPNTDIETASVPSEIFEHFEGERMYELTNHLGNVLSTVSDSRVITQSSGTITNIEAVLVSYTDYYPFGSPMPGRQGQATAYRYGFNGKEKDPEGMGGGQTTYDYGFRIYNPAIGRFLSVDPLAAKFPWYTPYQFAGNRPIAAVDIDGLEDAFYLSVTYTDGSQGPLIQIFSEDSDFEMFKRQFAHDLGIEVTDFPSSGIVDIHYISQYEGPSKPIVTFTPNVFIDGRNGWDKFTQRLDRMMMDFTSYASTFSDPNNGYEFRHAIQSADISVNVQIQFAQYTLSGNIGIFSTSENTFGFYGKMDYEVGQGLQFRSLWPTASASVTLDAMSTNEFVKTSEGDLQNASDLNFRTNSGAFFGVSTEKSLRSEESKVKYTLGFGVGVGSSMNNGYNSKLAAKGSFQFITKEYNP
jgi:RHS repeat-associated protein